MKKIYLSALVLVSFLFRLSAQEDSAAKALEEVVITANRFPQKQSQTGKVVTIIPRTTLEKSTGRSLGEVLNQYSGMNIIGANNNPGTNLDVYTRGAGLGNTLILVDGVPLYDVSSISSAFDINFFNVEQVERIEILKGGQSTVYGSDAVAGVINIIMKKRFKKPLQFNASAAAGSFDAYKLTAGVSGTSGKNNYGLQYQHYRSGGMSSAYDSSGKGNFDRDGFTQNTFNGQFSGKLSKQLDWQLNGQAGSYKADLDANAFTDDRDNTAKNSNYLAGGGLTYNAGTAVIKANYNLNSTTRKYVDDSFSVGGFAKYSNAEYKGLSHFAELYANFAAGKSITFLAGTDARWQQTDQTSLSISSYGPYETSLSKDSAKISIYSLYASGFYHYKNSFFLELGTRFNHHSMYGDNLTYTINPSLVIKQWKLFINLSSAFKAPTLYQLYDPVSGYAGLKPEKSANLEAGIQYSAFGNAFQARTVYFQRKGKDGIDYSFVDFRYFNNNSATDKGLELESFYRKGKWNLSANYTYLNGEVNTIKYRYDPNSFSYIPDGDTSYNYQFRRPAHSVNISAGYQFTKQLFVSTNIRFAGKRYEPRFQEAPIPLDQYHVADLYAEYKFNQKFRLFVDLKNILNAGYIDIYGFSTRRRNFMAGASIQL
jgi:vitamin B12 transporter